MLTPGSSSESKALLIYPDITLAANICAVTREVGLPSVHTSEPLRGLALALQSDFEIILLHLNLTGVSGLELIHQIRRRRDVLLLCFATAAANGIAALQAGADDFILERECLADELRARLLALLRRSRKSHVAASELHIGDLRINSAMRTVHYRGVPVKLTSMEFDLLELLTRSAGRIVSRDEIATILNQRSATPFERAIDVHVSRLRKKLRTDFIRSIRGVGYLFQTKPLTDSEGIDCTEVPSFIPSLGFSESPN